MEQIKFVLKNSNDTSLIVNLLKELKYDILNSIASEKNLETIALYIIQVEIINLIQKYNIFRLGEVFTHLFTPKDSHSYLQSFINVINLIKSKNNGKKLIIISDLNVNFDFETFIHILTNFFEKCSKKSLEIDNFAIGLTYEYFMYSKRKAKTGSFYTPLNLVKAICKKTINMHLYYSLDEDTFLHNYSDRVSLEKLKLLVDRNDVNKLHSLIKSMTILDPSMGVGNFLVESYDYLIFLYKFFEVEGNNDLLWILKNQLFGIDINEISIKIASIRLLFLLNEHNLDIEKIPEEDYSPNLIAKNSLTELPPMSYTIPFYEKVINNKFSIVLSNPPYSAKLDDKFKKEAKKKFLTVHGIEIWDKYLRKKKLSKGNPNSAVLFTEICGNLLPELGFCAIILPKSFLYIEAWESLRVYLSEMDLNVVSIIDLQKGFEGVLLEQIICIFNKRQLINRKELRRNSLDVVIEEFNNKNSFNLTTKGIYFNFNKIIINTNDQFRRIFSEIKPWTNFQLLSHRGLVVSKYLEKKKTNENTVIIRGRDIQPLYIRSLSYCPTDKIIDKPYFQYGTLMIQRIIAHVNKPQPHIILTVALNPGIPTVDTIVNIYTKDKGQQFSKALAIYLHSEFINWYAYHFIYCDAIRSMDIFGYYLNQVPIKDLEKYQEILVPYFEIVTFLKTLQKYTNKEIYQLNSKITFFERLSNAIIYYIYIGSLNTSDTETKDYFVSINTHKLKITFTFDFDKWYRYEQFLPVENWKINTIDLLKKLEIIQNNIILKESITYIEDHPLVQLIMKEFR